LGCSLNWRIVWASRSFFVGFYKTNPPRPRNEPTRLVACLRLSLLVFTSRRLSLIVVAHCWLPLAASLFVTVFLPLCFLLLARYCGLYFVTSVFAYWVLYIFWRKQWYQVTLVEKDVSSCVWVIFIIYIILMDAHVYMNIIFHILVILTIRVTIFYPFPILLRSSNFTTLCCTSLLRAWHRVRHPLWRRSQLTRSPCCPHSGFCPCPVDRSLVDF